jgi:hypothetical protein
VLVVVSYIPGVHALCSVAEVDTGLGRGAGGGETLGGLAPGGPQNCSCVLGCVHVVPNGPAPCCVVHWPTEQST